LSRLQQLSGNGRIELRTMLEVRQLIWRLNRLRFSAGAVAREFTRAVTELAEMKGEQRYYDQ